MLTTATFPPTPPSSLSHSPIEICLLFMLRKPIYRYVFHFENMCQPVLFEVCGIEWPVATPVICHCVNRIVGTLMCRRWFNHFHSFIWLVHYIVVHWKLEFTFAHCILELDSVLILSDSITMHCIRILNVPFVRFSLVVSSLEWIYLVQVHWC